MLGLWLECRIQHSGKHCSCTVSLNRPRVSKSVKHAQYPNPKPQPEGPYHFNSLGVVCNGGLGSIYRSTVRCNPNAKHVVVTLFPTRLYVMLVMGINFKLYAQ